MVFPGHPERWEPVIPVPAILGIVDTPSYTPADIALRKGPP
jgi:hypothetical protein